MSKGKKTFFLEAPSKEEARRSEDEQRTQHTVYMLPKEKAILSFIAKARGFKLSRYILIAAMSWAKWADEEHYTDIVKKLQKNDLSSNR